ncbi:plasminogen-like [Branchiostoma floridae x Branchiostoma belcheri]
MRCTVLLLCVLLASCLSAPAPPKVQKESLLKERTLLKVCPADVVQLEKYNKLQESEALCRGDVTLIKEGLHQCKDKLTASLEKTAEYSLQLKTLTPQEEKVEHCFVPEMDCFTGYGHYYRGTARVTENGNPCQSWEAQSPHRHTRTPQNYPHDDLAGNNYCRNPDWGNRPWCYVDGPTPRWEYCAVPRCPGTTAG